MNDDGYRTVSRCVFIAALSLAALLGACGDDADRPLEPGEGGVQIDDPIDPPGPEPIAFADSLLERAVRDELGIGDRDLTARDLLKLEQLSTIDLGITDLRGLEHCSRLESLFLMEEGLDDASHLEVIARLPQLDLLMLQSTAISSLEPLAGLDQLTTLVISSSRSVDAAALAGLTSVTWLALCWPGMSDLGPVASLVDLTSLSLSGRSTPDLAPISGLTKLDNLTILCDQGPTDLTPLADLRALRWLVATNASAEDLSPLASLHRLEYLDLSMGRFHDLAGITHLESLETVSLRGAWLLDEAWDNQIPCLRARGVTVRFELLVPREVLGTWSLDSIHVDGEPVDVADHLGWPPETRYRRLSFYGGSSLVAENRSTDGTVLRRERGWSSFEGGELRIRIGEVDGEEVDRHDLFQGTWRVVGGRLVLTSIVDGETVEAVWTSAG